METTVESLLNQGYQARREHRLEDARSLYTQAVDLCRNNADTSSLAVTITRLGGIERDLREIDASLRHYQDAVAIYRTLNEPLALAHTVRHVGDILRASGQLASAQPCYEEALRIYRNHPNTGTLDLANTLRGFALLKAALGQTEDAIAMWQETGALYNQVWQEPGSPFTESDLAPGIAESKRQIALLSQS
jgi:tetratricopeptide (TPR) repeat protein